MAGVKANRNKVLIIFLAGIGDLILFTPVLKGLLRHYKNCDISVIVPPELVQCARNMPYFAEVAACETSSEYNQLRRILELVRLCVYVVKKKYDMVITPLAVDCITASILTYLGRSNKKIGYTSDKRRRIFTECIKITPVEHDVVQNLKVLSILDIGCFDKKTEFYISKKDVEDADMFLKEHGIDEKNTLIAIHPLTNVKKRNWPAERFARLGCKISRAYGANIIIFGDSKQRKDAEKIGRVIGEKAVVQAGETSIQAAAAILKRCKLLICNDSSMMHIAAAIGTPMVAVWGPSNHMRRAYFEDDQIVVRKNLPCSPCPGGMRLHKCDTKDCLLQVSIGDVFSSCEKILSRKK